MGSGETQGQRPPQVRKLFGDLILELLQSLQVLRDCNGLLRAGGRHHVIPLSGQLRALLLENRRDAHALLLEVASQLGDSLSLFVMEGVDSPLPHGLPEPVFRMAGFPMSMARVLAGQTEIPLRALPEVKVLLYEGKQYSFRDVVTFYANRSGGAHYSKTLPEGFARIVALPWSDTLPAMMLQASEAVYDVGVGLIQRLTDFELWMDVGVAKPKPGGCLVDVDYPGSSMRLKIMLGDKQQLRVLIHGLGGESVVVEVPDLDWSLPHTVRVSTRLAAEDLTTRVGVEIDEDPDLGHEVQSLIPVFIWSDLKAADVTWNRSADADDDGMTLAVSECVLVGQISNEDSRSMRDYFTSSRRARDRRVVVYSESSFGRSPVGSSDIQMVGPVAMGRMDEVMHGPVARRRGSPESGTEA